MSYQKSNAHERDLEKLRKIVAPFAQENGYEYNVRPATQEEIEAFEQERKSREESEQAPEIGLLRKIFKIFSDR